MKAHPLRTACRLMLVSTTILSFNACSSHDVADRQDGVTSAHQGMINRRETRQEARDERFRASRESWMN
ncbi:MAG: hypothetical protein ACAI37_26055 [Chthoniobacter sp.]